MPGGALNDNDYYAARLLPLAMVMLAGAVVVHAGGGKSEYAIFGLLLMSVAGSLFALDYAHSCEVSKAKSLEQASVLDSHKKAEQD